MRQFLQEQNIAPNQAPRVKMQRILDGLYDTEQGFIYSARETLSASEAFEKKRGNCVSFAMLFVALARESGLDAHFNQIDYSPSWNEIDGILVETSHINAIVYLGGRQYVIESMPEYAEVASRSHNPISDARVFSHYFNNSGLLALARNEPENAKTLIDKALTIDPTNGSAWQNRGLYHFRHGSQAEGEDALLEAAKKSKHSASACYLLSQYYQEIGEKAKAEHFAKQGAKRSKKNPFFHYKKCQDALVSGDIKKSIKHLEKALELLPRYTPFQLELASLKESLAQGQKLALK